MEELIRVLERTVSNSQTDQNQAVGYIQDYIQRDFTGFITALADVLYDQLNPPVVRAAAGLQLKNQLTARDETFRSQQQERWRTLTQDVRQYIKQRLFQTLGTEVFRPTSAPQCVAYIAVIELAEGSWPDLIRDLTTNVTSPNSTPQLRLASIETIGFICQDIDYFSVQPADADAILTAIVNHGLKDIDSNDVKLAATAALLNFCDSKIQKISKIHQSITFDKLGEYLKIEPQYAEQIVAQMIRDERLQGHIDQIARVVFFDSKDVMQVFDEEILHLCSEINDVIEKIRKVAPEDWWAANAQQA